MISRFSDLQAHIADPSVPLVAFDLRSVETYLLIRPLAWIAPESSGAVWCPFTSAPAPLDLDRDAARRTAQELGLALNWPERHPAAVPRAMRMAALAAERECAAGFTRAVTRTAFGAGVDIDRLGLGAAPHSDGYLLRIDAKLGIDPDEAMRGALEGSEYDRALQTLAGQLSGVGIASALALRWRGEVYVGASAITRVLARCPNAPPVGGPGVDDAG